MDTSNAASFDAYLVDRLSLVLDAAKAAGADDANAVISEHDGLNVSVRHAKTEDLEREEQRGLTLDVYLGQRKASIRLNSMDDEALGQAASRAVAMAKVVPQDPYAGLAEPREFAQTRDAEGLDLNDPSDPLTQSLLEYAKTMEDAALSTDGVSNSEGAQVGWERSSYLMANSRGFLGGFKRSGFNGFTSPVAGNGDAMQSDYEFFQVVHAQDMPAPETIGQMAAQKAVARLGAGRLATGIMPVVYDRELVGRMLGTLMGAIQGPSIARGTSFLREKLGQAVLPSGMSVVEDPSIRRGLRSAPFDGAGMRKSAWKPIDNGVLNSWVMDLVSARQLGLSSTGNTSFSGGVSLGNVRLEGGSGTLEQLIADIGHGFYVTALMGHGTNALTGDYSQGASGFVIRNGKVAEAIENMTVAGHMGDMLLRARFGDDMRYKTGMDAPTMRVDDMSVAGT